MKHFLDLKLSLNASLGLGSGQQWPRRQSPCRKFLHVFATPSHLYKACTPKTLPVVINMLTRIKLLAGVLARSNSTTDKQDTELASLDQDRETVKNCSKKTGATIYIYDTFRTRSQMVIGWICCIIIICSLCFVGVYFIIKNHCENNKDLCKMKKGQGPYDAFMHR